MFTSLRSRLFLTYALVIGAVLLLVALALALFLAPSRYRQSVDRLRIIGQALAQRSTVFDRLAPRGWQAAAERADAAWDVRVVVLDAQGTAAADSRRGSAAPLAALPPPGERWPLARVTVRDASGRPWLFAVTPLEGGLRLVTATPRPRLTALALLRQDALVDPFFQAGLLALLLSLVLAVWIARWVAAPLQRIAAAARQVAAGRGQPIPVQGPREVQDLARAFNEMTAQVQASQQSQRDFVSNVSHELKTPLTSIQGFAQAILDGTAGTPDEQQRAAGVISAEAGRMHRLVLDLLDLARLDAGIAGLAHAPVDLVALLRGVAARLRPQAQSGGVELHEQLAALPQIQGDADRLAQVFTNLVDNALKHTPPGGQVTLRASLAGAQVAVAVADTGPGILPEDLPRIFERFYQADKSRRGGPGRGVGLGLAIAREIVQAHAGAITVQSLPGQGTTFMVKLPLDHAARLHHRPLLQ